MGGGENQGILTGWELYDHEGDLHRADVTHAPDRTRKRRLGDMGNTHICLDKQLPCLYPFPQRSQRRSAGARFPSVFMWAPSLARRLRPLGIDLPSSSELLGEGLRATGGSWLGLFMLRERYELNPEVPPTEVDSSPLRAPRLRRCAAPIGSEAASPPSFIEAATAAAALAAAVVTLLRRVIRWLALTAPSDIE